MGRYQQQRSVSERRSVLIYNTGWKLQADEEDGAVEMTHAK
ncbi:MAG: hypothetical protein QGF69_03225 [Candidatus Marinimicrobia bacterium]|nr:hypothetical protein [Candidatus Neomarinimicrobiota bacterium]